MQIVGPTYSAKPVISKWDDGDWCCHLHGGGPIVFADTPKGAYDGWRQELLMDHQRRYAHDLNHKLYFPGDPEWKWQV